MKKQLLLLCVPFIFSCGNNNECLSGDCKNGQGTMMYGGWYKYVGEFKDNKRNGQGIYTEQSIHGDEYVGEWENDKKNGHGTYTYGDGHKYVGDFKDNKMHGKGTMIYTSRINYIGEEAKYHKTINGYKYVGEFKDNKRHGKGTMIYSNNYGDGDKYVGEWKSGKEDGQGVYTYASGRVSKGLFEGGVFVGIDSVEKAKKQQELERISQVEKVQRVMKEKYPDVIDFLEIFYSSFDSLNDLSTFKPLIHKNSFYSEERVNQHWADWDILTYLGVRSIEYTSQSIEVVVDIAYHLYETGSFYNLERLKLVYVNDTLKMKEWSDIGLYKMDISLYDGMENYNEVDVYNRIGSDFYKNQQDTLFKSWYEKNKISSKSNYKSKKLNGLCKKWRENGDLWYEYNYKNGQLDGLFKSWHLNGQLSYETNYKLGKRDGSFIGWYRNGQLSCFWNYKDGKKDGTQKYWKEDGQLESKTIYEDGVFIQHLK